MIDKSLFFITYSASAVVGAAIMGVVVVIPRVGNGEEGKKAVAPTTTRENTKDRTILSCYNAIGS